MTSVLITFSCSHSKQETKPENGMFSNKATKMPAIPAFPPGGKETKWATLPDCYALSSLRISVTYKYLSLFKDNQLNHHIMRDRRRLDSFEPLQQLSGSDSQDPVHNTNKKKL